MKRSTFIRILAKINTISNDVSVVENFNNKSLITFNVPMIIGETSLQKKAFERLLHYATYYKIVPENDQLAITVTFAWE
ncbi:MAG: hypothetical protein H6Q65_785 [Firmicutes bacterium]|nr:hypothetical protein [Bacillota bacterium]